MDVSVPRTLDEALAALADRPDAMVLAGGTDVMVGVNAGRQTPTAVVALRAVEELRTWSVDGDRLRLGAGLTYADLLAPDLAAMVPALAQAARTVGSPPIRNAGTVGGNLATASPAGDTLPVLLALDAELDLASVEGRRTVALRSFLTGPKRTQLRTGELIVAARVPATRPHQEYRKVGVRNAMVIAVASVAVVVDADVGVVACAMGSVGPTPLRAPRAEEWVAGRIDWGTGVPDAGVAAEFGRLVAEESRPIDDHRSTAAYRRHAVEVLARRALESTLAGVARAEAA
ncbi:MAG: putative xanthine dehydrogenase FAD-binding subunit [Acidimicrobiales bacterium]|nr:putative xanthine dehydrogenase FAD-binding subunit [Acidimicrobiales bacterium]